MKTRLLILFLFLGFQLFAIEKPEPLTDDYVNNDYTGNWGQLRLDGTKLVSEEGCPVQLKGWSTHGLNYGNAVLANTFNSEAGFRGMKSFGANVARIAAYASCRDGITTQKMEDIIEWVKNCMKWTHDLKMYCIVDYHMLYPGLPTRYLSGGDAITGISYFEGSGIGADDFFTEICMEVQKKGYTHVIYEICNEPNERERATDTDNQWRNIETWQKVQEYANTILPIIGAVNSNAVVIVGTPQWDQLLSSAVSRKIVKPAAFPDLNIMYAFHYYACSHGPLAYTNPQSSPLENQLKKYSSQIPVFATEWSLTGADGKGGPCYEDTDKFINFCSDEKISWCSWSWSGALENSAALVNPGDYTDSYTYDFDRDLKMPAGKYVAGKLQENNNWCGTSLLQIRKSQSVISNPAFNGILKVFYSKPAMLVVSDIKGQSLFSVAIADGYSSVDTQLPAGIYFVSIRSDDDFLTQKVIIE